MPRSHRPSGTRREASPHLESTESLYRLHGSQCFALARRIVGDRQSAEQVLRDVFADVAKQRANGADDQTEVWVWLMTMTHRMSIELIRRRDSATKGHSQKRLPGLSAMESAAPAGHGREMTLLGCLPGTEAEIVRLAYFGGLQPEEIAHRLDLPVESVRRGMVDGLRGLHRELAAPRSRTDAVS